MRRSIIDDKRKLVLIKLAHTFIWAAMAFCVIYVFLAGVLGFLNFFVYASIIIILGEGLVLLAFKWSCPLTLVAGRYTERREDNFDIYLPEILARHNKIIFTALFMVGLFLIIARRLFWS